MATTIERITVQPRNTLAIAILLIIAGFGFSSNNFQTTPSASASSQRIVSLYVDDQKRVITTDDTTVSTLLRDSGVKLAAGDVVEPSVNAAIPNGFFNINVYRARPIVVHDGDKTYQFSSAYQSPHLLAAQAGLTLYPEDTYTTAVVTDFVAPAEIGVGVTVNRATPITVHIDGANETIRTQAKTVGTALAGAGVKLGLKDTISVPDTTAVMPGLNIEVTRVTDVTATLTDVVPFSTTTLNDPTTLVGSSKVQTPGVNGSRTGVWLIHYQNGAETGRVLQSLTAQTAPVTQVMVIGTKVLFAGSVEYWRPQVVAAATAYGLDPNKMLRIMACESGGNATSVSRLINDGQHPEGLFQFLPTTWISIGGTMNNILDGPTQIQLAAKKMRRDGFSAWACQ
ncbi:G5 domain-containing protein [Candidatus Saccharibacteria bacterium]|nr:G5 domain-containing protein [Candidatus Saccharibacteria bacterium]